MRDLDEKAGVLALVLLMGVVTAGIITRYVLNSPFLWTEEAARILFIAMVMIGSSYALKARAHPVLTYFVDLLPKRPQLALAVFRDAVTAALLLILIYWGTELSIRSWGVTTSALGLPLSLAYGLIPLSALLMLIRLVAQVMGDRRTLPSDGQPVEPIQ